MLVHRLLQDVESQFLEVPAQPPPGYGFPAGRRVDIDERARQLQEIDRGRLHATLLHKGRSNKLEVLQHTEDLFGRLGLWRAHR